LAYDPILQGPLPAPRDSIKAGGEKLNAMLAELYSLQNTFAFGIPATAVGISTANTGAQNKAAFEAFIALADLAIIRDEYRTGRALIFPVADVPYIFDGETVVRCTMEIRGGGVHQRFTGSPVIQFTDGWEYGWRFPYVDVGDPVAGGWWCRVKDLEFKPTTAGGVDYGIINNCSMFFDNVSCLNFKYGGFLSAGQSSGTHDVPAPYETGGATTMLGSVNITRFLWCSGRGSTQGDGFIASGNIAAIILYDQCNGQLNNGCGFRDNTSIGCYYAFCHTAQNSVKTTHHGGTTGSTTDAAGYAINATTINLASAGVGAIDVNDLVSFDNGDTTRYLVTAGDDDVSNGGSLTISTRISASGTIESGTGLKVAIPTSATAITVYKFYASIKDHTSGATTEPGIGADWKTYWVPVTGQIADNAWTTSTFFRATGGINCVFDPTSAPCHVNIGQYSEGGQEVGYVPRGAGYAYGGNIWTGRAYIGPDASGFQFPTNTPTWKSSDETHSWGAGLGTGYTAANVFACGDTNDTDVNPSTPNKGGLQLSYNPSRNSWEWIKGTSNRVHAVSGPGYSRSGYTQDGLAIAEKGIVYGGWNGTSATPNTTLARRMPYTSRAAIPSGTVLVKGDFLDYTDAAAVGDVAVEKVTVAGTTTAIGGVGVTFAIVSRIVA
jgi:hypothetical protein